MTDLGVIDGSSFACKYSPRWVVTRPSNEQWDENIAAFNTKEDAELFVDAKAAQATRYQAELATDMLALLKTFVQQHNASQLDNTVWEHAQSLIAEAENGV